MGEGERLRGKRRSYMYMRGVGVGWERRGEREKEEVDERG